MQKLLAGLFFLCIATIGNVIAAEPAYRLGAGDIIRITVHNNPDLSLETRVSEAGAISFPLVGEVMLGGLETSAAEAKLAQMLESGGFVKQPQVNILVTQYQSQMISVLGTVYKPGRYPLDRATNLAEILAMVGGPTPDGSDLVTIIGKNGKKEYDLQDIVSKASSNQNIMLSGGEIVYVHTRDVSVLGQVNRPGKYPISGNLRTVLDFISVAGGVNPNGADVVTVTRLRGDKLERLELDVDQAFRSGDNAANINLSSGDSVYVPRAPMFYIYGEVQRPGQFRLERNMTVIQALAVGGGPTARGTQRGIKLHRRNAKGEIEKLSPAMTDPLLQDDVIYVQESLF